MPISYVAYQAAVDQEKQWNSYGAGGDMWGYGRWGGWGGYGGMQTTTVTSKTIRVGSVNLDIYDVATKQQIWRGEAGYDAGLRERSKQGSEELG